MSSLEQRVAALEAQIVGAGSGRSATTPGTAATTTAAAATNAVMSRLDEIQTSFDRQTTIQFRDLWKESLMLLKELDPDIALTHQQQPLLYKRQQILASANNLQRDMEQLDIMLKLLTTGTKTTASDNVVLSGSQSSSTTGGQQLSQQLRLDQIIQAPIIVGTAQAAPTFNQQERIDNLRLKFQSLTRRIQILQQQYHTLVETYHVCVLAISEKWILTKEQEQQQGKD